MGERDNSTVLVQKYTAFKNYLSLRGLLPTSMTFVVFMFPL